MKGLASTSIRMKGSISQINEMILNGQIDDAKTIALMYYIKMEGIDG